MIFTNNIEDLKYKLEWTETFTSFHNQKLNTEKSGGFVLNNPNKDNDELDNITLNGDKLNMNIKSFRYLGQTIDVTLNPNKNIMTTQNRKLFPIVNNMLLKRYSLEVTRYMYEELVVPVVGNIIKYQPLHKDIINQWDKLLYYKIKNTLNVPKINVSKNGMYNSLGILKLEYYNIIVPLTETMVYLNKKGVSGRLKRERTLKLVNRKNNENILDHRKGYKEDRINKIVKKISKHELKIHMKNGAPFQLFGNRIFLKVPRVIRQR